MDAADASTLPQDLVFVDLETTGGNAAYHRITEVGIVRVEQGVPVEEWSSLVNPECRIPAYIESFTGISNEMVADAPRFADIARLVLEKLRSPAPRGPAPREPAQRESAPPAPVFVAHNARFDYSFLRAEFRRVDLQFCAKVLCTVKLSRRLFPQHSRHSLDAVMERHDLVCHARHRALGDARVLSDFWFKLRGELPEAALAAAAHTVLGANRLPAHLPEGLADELPEGPGVYRFFGPDDVLLYVGRSNSLRTRVLSHFADEHTDTKQRWLGRDVRRIEWLETGGELGASLREAEWIKTQRPIYNRPFKPTADSFTLRIAENTGAAEFIALADVEPKELQSCCGVFYSQQQARKALTEIARAQVLCLKVLGLEPSAGSCVAYQVGKCKGACIGKEPLILHNVRTHMALSSLKLKAWPFLGRVALRERDALGGVEFHVLDHWSYLGTARSEQELAALAAQPASAVFDPHIYRILLRYFANHPKPDWHGLEASESLS
jgi:DNA polymerase III subunit epsilon